MSIPAEFRQAVIHYTKWCLQVNNDYNEKEADRKAIAWEEGVYGRYGTDMILYRKMVDNFLHLFEWHPPTYL
jgi:hypothetical protein